MLDCRSCAKLDDCGRRLIAAKVCIIGTTYLCEMLAYVFWHTPKQAANLTDYESDLRRFHATLASEPPPGFVLSHTYRCDALPWFAATAATIYEDWYLIEDSRALDFLNAAAVSGARTEPHNRLAAAAETGAGGLYRVRAGVPPNGQLVAHWFRKPDGTSYGELDRVASDTLGEDGTLWQRQMTLGPGFEFCLSATTVRSMPSFSPVVIVRSEV